jgi:hypothetical protein
MSMFNRARAVRVTAAIAGVSFVAATSAFAQSAPPATSSPAAVERIGPNQLRIGNVNVDLSRREISVTGKVNMVMTLEFLAGTMGGNKGYETALELETDAVRFNTACLLIGLDPAHAVRPERHFDPRPPAGDPVEITVSWDDNGSRRTVDGAQLLYDRQKDRTLEGSRWVYTGSTIIPNGPFMAEQDGVLIGFVHTPAPLIENVSAEALNRYGQLILNPKLGLSPGSRITVTVRALPAATAASR